MTVLIENELGYKFDFDELKLADEVVRAVLYEETCPYEAEVNIRLVDDDTIKHVNSQFRDINAVTDVLSFPAVEFTNPSEYAILKGNEMLYFNPDTNELMLGDIMLSIPRTKEQAMEYGHELRREYAFLIVHSMLHLLGYDHLKEVDEQIMKDKQEIILDKLRITRES